MAITLPELCGTQGAGLTGAWAIFEDIILTVQRFVGLFRQKTTLRWTILMPLLAVAIAVLQFLFNETMIAQTSLTVRLVYLGLLPMLSHRVLLALVRTVDDAYAAGYGRL